MKAFEKGGLWGISSRGHAGASALQAEIEKAAKCCGAQPGFKTGLTLIVVCGFGRRMGVGFNGAEGWLVEVATDYDVEVMGWLQDFDFSELIRLSAMNQDLRAKGFIIDGLNGPLEKLGFSQANGGHLIPHEIMPEDFDGGIIYLPTNAHLKLRADHHRRWDLRSIATPEYGHTVVRRKSESELTRDGSSRIYCAFEDVERGRLRGVWIGGSRTWWLHASSQKTADKNVIYGIWDMQCVWMERIAPIIDRALPSLPGCLDLAPRAGSLGKRSLQLK